MSTHPAPRSRWMDWTPRILADTAESEPTKPSKPGFVGFDGATCAEAPKIETSLDPAEWVRASTVLNRVGVRIMLLRDGAAIGVWSDLDGPQIRAALRLINTHNLPIRYLDDADVPLRYKVRRVPEPIGMSWAAWSKNGGLDDVIRFSGKREEGL